MLYGGVAAGRARSRNQSLFREVNERVAELNQTFEQLTRYGSWACECAGLDCLEQIQMTLGEYEALREHATHFAVVPGEQHLVLEVEHVVERTDRYWVVEKVGVAGAVAKETADSG